MKVLIIESSHSADFYNDRLDGLSTLQLLKLLNIKSELRIALDEQHLSKALRCAASENCDVIHVSCHGDEKGIDLADGSELSWKQFAEHFQKCKVHPRAVVMSACRGVT